MDIRRGPFWTHGPIGKWVNGQISPPLWVHIRVANFLTHTHLAAATVSTSRASEARGYGGGFGCHSEHHRRRRGAFRETWEILSRFAFPFAEMSISDFPLAGFKGNLPLFVRLFWGTEKQMEGRAGSG